MTHSNAWKLPCKTTFHTYCLPSSHKPLLLTCNESGGSMCNRVAFVKLSLKRLFNSYSLRQQRNRPLHPDCWLKREASLKRYSLQYMLLAPSVVELQHDYVIVVFWHPLGRHLAKFQIRVFLLSVKLLASLQEKDWRKAPFNPSLVYLLSFTPCNARGIMKSSYLIQ